MLITTVLVTGAALSGGAGEGVPRLPTGRCAQVRWLPGLEPLVGPRSLPPGRRLHAPSSQWFQAASAAWFDTVLPRWSDAALRRWLDTVPAKLPTPWRDALPARWPEGVPAQWSEVASAWLRSLAGSPVVTICEGDTRTPAPSADPSQAHPVLSSQADVLDPQPHPLLPSVGGLLHPQGHPLLPSEGGLLHLRPHPLLPSVGGLLHPQGHPVRPSEGGPLHPLPPSEPPISTPARSSESIPWAPRHQVDPHGSPGARMWTWPAYDPRPSETSGRDEDDDEPLLRIHQPAPIEAREQRPSTPRPETSGSQRPETSRQRRPETSGSQRPGTSRQRRPETSSRQRRHDITHRDEQEFPTQDHGAEHLGQDDGKKHRRGALPIGAPGRSSAHTVAGKSKPLESSTARSTFRSGRAASGTVAASAALRQLGTPYVWGGGSGAGATGGGFDCSGLALYAWARAGVSLPHYTGTQFTKGTKIPFSQLRPGDLVFFGGGSGDPTHVGIYLKNGVMIHAPKSGDVVRKVDFAHSPYYRARYRGAIRPSN